jgi:hypothetical protein
MILGGKEDSGTSVTVGSGNAPLPSVFVNPAANQGYATSSQSFEYSSLVEELIHHASPVQYTAEYVTLSGSPIKL